MRYTVFCRVAPLVGAWIEIAVLRSTHSTLLVAPLVGAWIEIILKQPIHQSLNRRSPRGSVD